MRSGLLLVSTLLLATCLQAQDSPLAAKSELQQQAMQLTGIAEELKAAAGKTKKFELSLAVIRKANEVERLSHHMQATAVKK